MSKQVDWPAVQRDFMLSPPPDEVYLNAGTFSALPRPVYDEMIRLIAATESNPTWKSGLRGCGRALWATQQRIAAYVGAEAEDLVFHVNVTQALNQAIFGLAWPRDGEVLVSSQEYGAIVNAIREMARRHGLGFRTFELPVQPATAQELCDAVLAALSPQTTGVLLSHVTSASGIVTPVEQLAPLLRRRGVRFIVDGAHGPGLLPLQLGASQIDIYGGNLHKWFLGPKGTGFLYVDREVQGQVQPLAVGWGGTPHDTRPIHETELTDTDSRFQAVFRFQGLRDLSPLLALGATLDYREALGETAILRRIEALCDYTQQRLEGDLGLKCLSPQRPLQAGLLAFAAPPAWSDAGAERRLFERHRITVPMWTAPGLGPILRVSPHIWNSERDVDRLAEALG